MSAAAAAFADRGFDGATVEFIARKARVNKAMISYHFGGKEGLYHAILLSTFAPAVERMKALRDSDQPADQQLKQFVDLFAGLVARQPRFPAMMLREVLSGGRHMDEDVLPLFLTVFSTVREIVAKGIRSGQLRSVDPLLTHLSLIGALVFYFATEPLRDRLFAEGKLPVVKQPPAAFVKHMQEMVAHGLAAELPKDAPGSTGD